MSSYKQLSNQGTLLLGAGASVSRDKRRPISAAISTGHSRRRRRSPLATRSKGMNGQSSRVAPLRLQIEPELCYSGKKLQSRRRRSCSCRRAERSTGRSSRLHTKATLSTQVIFSKDIQIDKQDRLLIQMGKLSLSIYSMQHKKTH